MTIGVKGACEGDIISKRLMTYYITCHPVPKKFDKNTRSSAVADRLCKV